MIRMDGPIWDLWNAGGPFVGDDAQPDTRVYVERRFQGVEGDYLDSGWELRTFNQTLSSGQTVWARSFFWQPILSHEFDYFGNDTGPYGDDPVLLQVPNLKNVHIDRSLDAPAATITLSIYNQQMTDAVICDAIGTPGYYSWNMGDSTIPGASQARWNRDTNPWHGVLVPNALLRTYQGFGGIGMDLSAAIAAGHLVNTGWWLIDEVTIGTDGMLQIKGRDMAKLLIEQRLFPFIVPQDRYPLKYSRWITNPEDPTQYVTGNYRDYTDIVNQILLWCGWAIWGGLSGSNIVFGNIESTGVPGSGSPPGEGADPGFSVDSQGHPIPNNGASNNNKTYTLAEDFFDKKPAIDVIQELKQIVGYNFWIDAGGGARFQTPNWWAPGNILTNGTRVEFIPDIDEKLQLTDLKMTYSDKNARTGIMILPKLPDKGISEKGWRQSDSQGLLSGIFKLAIWINEVFKDDWSQIVMAELINMQITRSLRVFSVSAIANPCIELDDQVWIWERQTSSGDIHYVKSITTDHDLDSGTYSMQLNTVWLGTMGDASIAAEWLAHNESTATGPIRLDNTESGDGSGLLTEDGDVITTEDGDQIDA